jgi:ribosomal protein S18 acetylase RimI-like enzyme
MVRLAIDSDIPRISLSHARAFVGDPLWRWLLPADDFIGRMMIFGSGFLHSAVPNGTVYTTDDGVSAAIWAAPGHQDAADVQAVLATAFEAAFGPNLQRFQHFGGLLAANRPPFAHWYLAGLGTHPDWQGQGLASSVMRPVLERCDAENIPAYLEATKAGNVPFYQRHGFEVTDTLDLPDGGPTTYLMWRKPQRKT